MGDSSNERFSEGWDEHAKKAFSLMEPDNDTVTASMLEYFFQIMGENPSKSDVSQSLQAIDKKLDSSLTFDDCVSALKSYVQATEKEKMNPDDIVRIVSAELDPQNRGIIKKDALVKTLTQCPTGESGLERLSKEEIELILAELKMGEGETIKAADFFSLLLDI